VPRREITINAPVERVFEVIRDFKAYPEFVMGTEAAKVRKTAKGLVVDFTVNLVKKIQYSILVDEKPPHQLSWTFLEGEFMKKNEGSWTLEPVGKNKTKAIYDLDVGFGWMVPQSLVDQLTKVNLPLMLESFKKRAEEKVKES
jgi:ribosome-associated toxin RatA of RatAB toxin-antitoxin module